MGEQNGKSERYSSPLIIGPGGQLPGSLIRPTNPDVTPREPDRNCPLCNAGASATWLKCWQCTLQFHVHVQAMAHIPNLANVMLRCPAPDCNAPNAFTRVGNEFVNADEFNPQERQQWGLPR